MLLHRIAGGGPPRGGGPSWGEKEPTTGKALRRQSSRGNTCEGSAAGKSCESEE